MQIAKTATFAKRTLRRPLSALAPASLRRQWSSLKARYPSGTPLYASIFLAAVALGLLLALVAPLATALVESWTQRDATDRAAIIHRSLKPQADTAIGSGGLERLFAEVTGADDNLALAYCPPNGNLRAATAAMPPSMTCAAVSRGATPTTATVKTSAGRYHLAAFPLATGHLIVAQSLALAEARERQARRYVTLALLVVIAGLGAFSTVLLMTLMRGWVDGLRRALRNADTPRGTQRAFAPLVEDIRILLDDIKAEQRFTDQIHIEWSPATLHKLIENELPGAELFIVSNREPYIHNKGADGSIVLQTPASGLVAALEPVARACQGTWIAHGSGSADQLVVDQFDRVPVPPDNPTYKLRRVWLSDEEQEGYYYGFANEGIWPLCHVAFVRPTFRENDWRLYREVNERFADAVVEEATTEDPIILVQDYHFALLPRMLRQRLPKATIVAFWHIPWPNAETFGICPYREELIDGLLGSTILGFHTQFHCNNFLEATDRFMESRIDREEYAVSLAGHETQIRPYPISIEWPPAALQHAPPVDECRSSVMQRFGLKPDARIAVGIERFDYTKGILDRIRAIDDLLTREPKWRGRLAFIQAAAPTRSKLDSYSSLQADAEALAADVNARHGTAGYQPIHLVIRHHDQGEVYELFRAADVCIVSSLHDGMNLVAKEFVAARDDEQGVLVLSNFAGASRELSEAIIINPYDTHRTADALDLALSMPPDEQRVRMRLMREQVRRRNVHRWAAQMLIDAARIRRRATVTRDGIMR